MSLSIVSLFNPSEEKVRTITLYLATVGMFRSSQIHRLIATAIGGASVKRLGMGVQSSQVILVFLDEVKEKPSFPHNRLQ